MRTTITPELARDLLANNPVNRNVRKNLVARYAADIREGRWVYNGSTIIVGKSGRLLDGQHRLNAVVEADLPIEVELIEGMDEDVFVTIDTGAARTAGDVFHIKGYPNASNLASIARAAVIYLRGGPGGLRRAVSNPELEAFVAKHERLQDVTRQALRARGVVSPGAIGSVIFLATATQNYAPQMFAFVDGVTLGEGLTAGDARLVLRNELLAFAQRRKGGIQKDFAMTAIAFAWNSYITETPIKNLRYALMESGVGVPDIIGAPKRGSGVDQMPVRKASQPIPKGLG